MILLHCTFTDDVLGIGQDSGYVNWYGQRMVISVFCIFVSPSFTCSLHSFHLNQRSKFWFGQFFFRNILSDLIIMGLELFVALDLRKKINSSLGLYVTESASRMNIDNWALSSWSIILFVIFASSPAQLLYYLIDKFVNSKLW